MYDYTMMRRDSKANMIEFRLRQHYKAFFNQTKVAGAKSEKISCILSGVGVVLLASNLFA